MASNSRVLLASLTLTVLGSSAWAHTVWLEPVEGSKDFKVMFGGHAGKIETYAPEKIKDVEAFDKEGKSLQVTPDIVPDGVRIHVDGKPAMIAMHFDNGIHTKPPTGPSIEKPMNEVPGAKRATNAVKYHKTIVDWSPLAMKTIGQPFEVVAVDAAAPVANKPFRVRVLQDGKPVAGVKLGRGEEGGADAPVTDANGVAAFIPAQGSNRLWAGKRIQVSGNPQYTELSYEYSFGFTAK